MLPVIVIVAYNRPDSLFRLLHSVAKAAYPKDSVCLIISIDGGGEREVREVAEGFNWVYGEKRVIVHDTNLGLKSHIHFCAGLSESYGSVIVLEDDLLVSPAFYLYASQALDYYGDCESIAGIALYTYRMNEAAECAPFIPMDNGSDVFFMRIPCSCGQSWTAGQWGRFKKWLSNNPSFEGDEQLPVEILTWRTSWKKMMYKYLVEEDLFFVYPYGPLSTNLGDLGVHTTGNTYNWQVPLSNTIREFSFIPFSKSGIVYDQYMELLPDAFKRIMPEFNDYDFCVDLYGVKQKSLFSQTKWLSSKQSTSPDESWALNMLPIENNVIYSISGSDIVFTDKAFLSDTAPCLGERLARIWSEYSFAQGQKKVRSSRAYRIGRKILDILKMCVVRK